MLPLSCGIPLGIAVVLFLDIYVCVGVSILMSGGISLSSAIVLGFKRGEVE